MIVDFPHTAPEGYYYTFEEFNTRLISIWLNSTQKFDYNLGKPTRTIWGFYSSSKRKYYAPINSKKQGSEVSISQTTPYTAMKLQQTPLERCFT